MVNGRELSLCYSPETETQAHWPPNPGSHGVSPGKQTQKNWDIRRIKVPSGDAGSLESSRKCKHGVRPLRSLERITVGP